MIHYLGVNMNDIKTIKIELKNMCCILESPSCGYIGLDLGPNFIKPINKIRFMPAIYQNNSMIGGRFQGSNSSEDDNYEDLFVIETMPNQCWNEVNISNTNIYRYIRYLSPDKEYCAVGRIEYYYHEQNKDIIKLIGVPFGSEKGVKGSEFDIPFKNEATMLSFKKDSDMYKFPFYISTNSDDRVFFHQHDFTELIYVKSGTCFHFMNNQIDCLFAGDVIFVKPMTTHTYFGGTNLEVINIGIYEDNVPHDIMEIINQLPTSHLFKNDEKIHIYIDQQKEFVNLLTTMTNDYFSCGISSYASLLGLFIRMNYLIGKYISDYNTVDHSSSLSLSNHNMVSGVISHLYENYKDIDNIKDLSKKYFTSYNRLAIIFSEETGITIMDYLNRIRISIACKKLIQKNESLTITAYNAGFNNYNNFGRIFKDIIGCTPQKFINFLGIPIQL